MKHIWFAISLTLVVFSGTAYADGGGSSPSNPASRPQQAQISQDPEVQNQMIAHELYQDGMKSVGKGDKDVAKAAELTAKGDEKSLKKAEKKRANAEKHYKNAIEDFQEATALYPVFADAWNMLGFSLRKSGDFDNAMEAYWECLRLEPKHFGAHEYLGEAYLQTGRYDLAQKELDWLEEQGAEEAKILQASIEAYVARNPGDTEESETTPGIDTAIELKEGESE